MALFIVNFLSKVSQLQNPISLKTIISIAAASLLLTASCQSDIRESREEIEYKNYVSSVKSKLSGENLSPAQRNTIFEQTYEESGLQDFIVSTLPANSRTQTLDELNTFYNDVIKGKYANHVALDNLKVRFIAHAVNHLGLTNPESPEEAEYLVKLTRDLIAIDQTLNASLVYDCLSACKAKIDKDEFNQMVKKAKFQIRFSAEQMNETLSKRKESEPKEPYEQLAKVIKISEKQLSDLEGLRIK